MKRSMLVFVFALFTAAATASSASADIVTYDIVRGSQDNLSYSYFASAPNSPDAGQILWWVDGTFSIDFMENGAFEFVSINMHLYPFESIDEVNPFAKSVVGEASQNTEESNLFQTVDTNRMTGTMNLLLDMTGGPAGTAAINFRPSSYFPIINSMTEDEIYMWGHSDYGNIDAVNGLENMGIDDLVLHLGGVRVVPEPASLTLALMSGGLLLFRRRR